jgi:hypothetical protein
MRWTIPAVLVFALVAGGCESEPVSPESAAGDLAFSKNAATSSVTGGGRVVYPPEEFGDFSETYGISARTRPGGTAEGMIEAHWRGDGTLVEAVKFHGDVTCLKVTGNSAWLGFTISRTDEPLGYPEGSKWLVKLVDDGAEDAVSYFYRTGVTCEAISPNFNPRLFAWTNGDLMIR